jgi:REP element-mobilizing transposase RayT
VYAAVVMRDHVHMLVQPMRMADGVWDLGELLHSVKSFSAHQIAMARKDRRDAGPTFQATIQPTIQSTNQLTNQIWQDERYDRWIWDDDEFAEKWQYIADNPVKKGLAVTAKEYRWLYVSEERPL